MPGLFNKKILDERIKNYEINNLDNKINKIKEWQKNLGRIKGLNEKRLQGAFLRAIFEDILGYENTPQKDNWTLDIEATTDVDAKHPDGIIGFFERTDNEEIRGHEAVIELKGPQISLDKDQKRQGTTYKSPVDQAFSYTNKLDKCKWVIVSNFMEIRLYKVGRSKEYFEVFLLDDLDKIETFKKFYYLLNKDNLLSETGNSITLELSEKTLKKEEDISVKFYNLYKNVRINLFEHLKEKNTDKDPELLLEKAQKFLDRIIFIGFCEDKGLLPNDLLHEAIQRGKDSFSPSDTAVWDQIRGVFRSIDKGNAAHNINAYNGGLFEYDEDLDGLVIENDFFEAIYKISDYDFDSDVDVNILGHIFEQSISDLEKLKSDIKDDEFDKNESKRKKDGIFYTPQYITSYIVENAIGGYLEDLKEELGYYELPDIEDAGSKNWKTIYTNQHLDFYNKYEEDLKDIKVLDPACGSGAFLNQAFDYLLKEHQWLNKQRDLLKGGQSSIFALDAIQRNILKNNIFGVDLNEESVEITKLSLWLKTANKNKPLTNLDDNIKCGNSLIDDPEVAGDKAFEWEKEFSNIMAAGGFDVVVGNPPYVRNEKIRWMKSYLENNYKVYDSMADLYCYFFEKGLNLLKEKGYFSFIVSNKFIKNDYGTNLRKFLMNFKIKEFLTYPTKKIFEGVNVDPCTILLKKESVSGENIINANNMKKPQSSLNIRGWYFNSEKELNIKRKLDKLGVPLDEWDLEINYGVKTGYNKAFIIEQNTKDELINNDDKSKEIIKPILRGRDIKKYRFEFKNKWLLFIPWELEIDNYPAVKEHLEKYYDKLSQRDEVPDGNCPWFALQRYRSDYFDKFEEEKIIYGQFRKGAFAYDNYGYYLSSNEYMITTETENVDLKYILGLLNSKLFYFYQKIILNNLNNQTTIAQKGLLLRLPIIRQNEISQIISRFANNMNDLYRRLKLKKKNDFMSFTRKYTSTNENNIDDIINNSSFKNKVYSGRASKIRNFTVNINTKIITIYLDKSSNGKYEVLKFEENDKYKRQYIKYYLENLTDEQLDEIDNKYSGNILKKTLQIEIPDYNKDHVVKKVVKEWESLQQEIIDLENEIERIDNEIDQMVYKLYNLTEEDIQIVEESI